MHTIHRSLSALAIIALVATLFSAVTTTSASAGADYQKPKVGECRNITVDQVYNYTNSTAPIDCSATHTAHTFYVGKLSQRVWDGSKRKIAIAVASQCNPAWKKAIGRPLKVRLQAAYSYAWWTPTKAQRREGARWFRCDLTLLRGRNALTPLTATSSPFLDVPTPDDQALCKTAKFYYTTCDAPHFLRVTGVFKIRKKAFPGEKRVDAIAERKCADLTSGANYYWDPPSKSEWKYGYKWVLCETIDNTSARLAAPSVGGREVGVLPDPGVHGYGGRG